MTFLININGRITTEKEALISVLDRGFLYGDSVYEVIRTYDGKLFALDDHLTRLENSGMRLAIDLPPRDELVAHLKETLHAADNEDSYCRIIVTRGTGPLTLDPTTAKDPAVVILVKPFEPFPDWMYEKGVRLAIPKIRRTSVEALDPAIKSGNYLNSVMAFKEARELGFDDALILDNKGLVAESTSSNIFVLSNGELATPPLETGLLAGVTRSIVISLARSNDIHCVERPITPSELLAADEVIMTSTLREVMSAVVVGKHIIGDGTPGPVAKRLKDIFHTHALSQ